jgi:N-acetylneuraminic acid mutarotase
MHGNTLKLMSISCLLVGNAIAQSWIPMPDFPSSQRDDAVMFSIGNDTYCGTGLSATWTTLSDFYKFNSVSETWSSIAALPAGEERQYATGFSGFGKGYVFGGTQANNYLNDLWQYQPQNNTWTEMAPLPAVGRGGSAGFVIGDTAYIIGGKTTTQNAIHEVWAYSLSGNSWTRKNNFPFGNRWRASATSLNQLGYLGFGKDELNVSSASFYSYHPGSDTWTYINDFPGAGRAYAGLLHTDSLLYVLFGSDDADVFYKDCRTLQVNQQQWTYLNELPAAPRRGGMYFTHNNNIYYTTGIDSSFNRLKETWKLALPLSLGEQMKSVIRVYPNPSQGLVNLIFNDPIRAKRKVKVYELRGACVFAAESERDSLSLDLSDLMPGAYFIECIIETGSETYHVYDKIWMVE